jgi:uncharacterized protein involved in exopolysaccharide biosynthesis
MALQLAEQSPGSSLPSPVPELTFARLLHVLRSRWLLILLTFLLCEFVVAVVTFFVLTPVYQARAVVLVKPGREFLSAPGRDVGGPVATMQGIALAELEILHSDDLIRETVSVLEPTTLYPELAQPRDGWLASLEERVRTRLGLPERGEPRPLNAAMSRFRADLSATLVPGSEVIRISLLNSDPALAADAVNLMIDRLKEHHLRAFGSTRSESFLKGKVEVYAGALNDSELALREFEAAHAGLGAANPAQEMEQQRARFETALLLTESEISALTQRLEYLRERWDSLKPVSKLRNEFALQLMQAEAEVNTQQGRRTALQEQLAGVEDRTYELPAQMGRYRELVRKRDSDVRRYQSFVERLEQARISAEMDRAKLTNISVIQHAWPPVEPRSPRKLLNLAVGSLLGLGLGLGLAFLLEGLRAEEQR